jgi:hypothetical protein
MEINIIDNMISLAKFCPQQQASSYIKAEQKTAILTEFC